MIRIVALIDNNKGEYMKAIKVVFHVMGNDRLANMLYAEGGEVHREYEKQTGQNIHFVSFYGQFLEEDVLNLFEAECSDAHVIILDAWNHPPEKLSYKRGEDPETEYLERMKDITWTVRQAQQSSAQVAERISHSNPQVSLFAFLMEARDKVDVHRWARPMTWWGDDDVIEAIKKATPQKLETKKIEPITSMAHRDSLPNVLIFDDTEIHRWAAIRQLRNDYNITVVNTYDEAESLIESTFFDIILLDLQVPASSKEMGGKGMQYIGQEMPITPFLMLLALKRGVKKIGLLTDTNHHHHPASACMDVFGYYPFEIGESKVVFSNSHVTRDKRENWVKNWIALVNMLQ